MTVGRAVPGISILVLTEDSGKHAHDTIAAAQAVYDVGASFAAAVDSLRACDALCQVLHAIASGA